MGIIEDGTGSGRQAEVTSENRLKIESITKSVKRHANEDEQNAYQLVFQQTPSIANGCFLYIKNENFLNKLIIEGFFIRTSGNEQIEIELTVTGTASGTSSIPGNCYSGSSNEAEGTFVLGNNITGLSRGTIIDRQYIALSNNSNNINFEQDIVIPTNQTFALYAVTGGIEIDGTLIFHYHD